MERGNHLWLRSTAEEVGTQYLAAPAMSSTGHRVSLGKMVPTASSLTVETDVP